MPESEKDKITRRLRKLRKSDLGISSIVQPATAITKMFRKDLHNHGMHYHLKFDVPFMYKLMPQKITIWYANHHTKWRFSINAIQGPESYGTREEASRAAIKAIKTIAASFSSISYDDLTPDIT
jgi:hypothetical protein